MPPYSYEPPTEHHYPLPQGIDKVPQMRATQPPEDAGTDLQPSNSKVIVKEKGGSKIVPITGIAIAIFIIYVSIKGSWSNVLGVFNFKGVDTFLAGPSSPGIANSSGNSPGPTPMCPLGYSPYLVAGRWVCQRSAYK